MEQIRSKREIDQQAENVVCGFLKKYLFDAMIANTHSSTRAVEWMNQMLDKKRQLRGVDFQLYRTDKKEPYKIDAKAQVSVVNAGYPTFCQELLSYQNGYPVDGWFINDDLTTQFYAYTYIKAESDDQTLLSEDTIKSLYVIFVDKKVLRHYCKLCLGMDERTLRDCAKQISKHSGSKELSDFFKKMIPDKRIHFTESKELSEAPVNLIVSIDLLQELSIAQYEVDKNGYRVVNDVPSGYLRGGITKWPEMERKKLQNYDTIKWFVDSVQQIYKQWPLDGERMV